MISESLNRLLNGSIPERLEDKTSVAHQLCQLTKRIIPISSILIAAARRDHFQSNISGWAAWCQETLELTGQDRDHRRAIGDMLLDIQHDHKNYDLLFVLPFNKLIVLTRIPIPQLAAYLSHHNPSIQTREELRITVAQWLGEETAASQPYTPALPGILEELDKLNSKLTTEIATPETAKAAWKTGMNLMGAAIIRMDIPTVCSNVTDSQSADMATNVGVSLLGAGLQYHKDNKNVELLQRFKLSLMEEIEEIEGIIANS